jgi:hypothetical protein
VAVHVAAAERAPPGAPRGGAGGREDRGGAGELGAVIFLDGLDVDAGQPVAEVAAGIAGERSRLSTLRSLSGVR